METLHCAVLIDVDGPLLRARGIVRLSVMMMDHYCDVLMT